MKKLKRIIYTGAQYKIRYSNGISPFSADNIFGEPLNNLVMESIYNPIFNLVKDSVWVAVGSSIRQQYDVSK